MWELTTTFLVQLIKLIPGALGVYLIFNFMRDFLFRE